MYLIVSKVQTPKYMEYLQFRKRVRSILPGHLSPTSLKGSRRASYCVMSCRRKSTSFLNYCGRASRDMNALKAVIEQEENMYGFFDSTTDLISQLKRQLTLIVREL